METRSKVWQELVTPHCAKLRMGAVFGGGTTFGPKGAEAMADMLGEMAIRLDMARDEIAEIKKLVGVTSESNKEGNE